MINWIKIKDEFPPRARDVLILDDSNMFGVGYFLYDVDNIIGMKFNGTIKSIDSWLRKPTHWAIVELPKD